MYSYSSFLSFPLVFRNPISYPRTQNQRRDVGKVSTPLTPGLSSPLDRRKYVTPYTLRSWIRGLRNDFSPTGKETTRFLPATDPRLLPLTLPSPRVEESIPDFNHRPFTNRNRVFFFFFFFSTTLRHPPTIPPPSVGSRSRVVVYFTLGLHILV